MDESNVSAAVEHSPTRPVIQAGRAKTEGDSAFAPLHAGGVQPARYILRWAPSFNNTGRRLMMRTFNPSNRKWKTWVLPRAILDVPKRKGRAVLWFQWLRLVRKVQTRFMVDPDLETLRLCYDRNFQVAKALVLAKRLRDGKIKAMPRKGANFDYDDRPKMWVPGGSIGRRKKLAKLARIQESSSFAKASEDGAENGVNGELKL